MSFDYSQRFTAAIAAIDAANADDPNTLTIDGETRPKELAHAEMLTAWVKRLRPEASEELLLAARAHHISRWEQPRSGYPAGRNGYLRWRRELGAFHAGLTREILLDVGYPEAAGSRVAESVQKRKLNRDAEVQSFEDGLCLVFLETQFEALAARTERPKMVEIVRKTVRKMSDAGREAAGGIELSEDGGAIVAEAFRLANK